MRAITSAPLAQPCAHSGASRSQRSASFTIDGIREDVDKVIEASFEKRGIK